MGSIRILPAETVAKIAAGQVIERPAFAVKELVENAIDARATAIKIDIEDSGLRKITVQDNGTGMDLDDLKTCYLPHSTSKLLDDTFTHITTLGFRGEALSSLVAVGDVQIISRTTKDVVGNQITLCDGVVENISACGTAPGTTVTVTHLLNRVPARKKFLKTLRTELRHIIELVTHYAISYPQIRFEMQHNGKTVIDVPLNQTVEARIKTLLGPSVYENLIPLTYEESYLRLTGFLCKPQVSSSSPHRHHIFVNNRFITDHLIATAVKEAYGCLLEQTKYPIFLLFITIPTELVDVNVHPRKEHISFYDNQFVFSVISKAVTQTLTNHNLTFYNLSWSSDQQVSSKLTTSYAASLLKHDVLPWENAPQKETYNAADVLQVHNLYLVCQTKQGVVFIDQHAAHERMLYAQLIKAFKKRKSKQTSCQLPKAVLLELPIGSVTLLDENLALFAKLGFVLEPFGEGVYKIEAVPVLFKDRDPKTLINEILDDIAQFGVPRDVDFQTQKMVSYLACRSAVKAGDKLTKQQAKEIIKQLNTFDDAYTCPHGRPLKIEMPLSQIDKQFKRR